jgi:hypothetical protein
MTRRNDPDPREAEAVAADDRLLDTFGALTWEDEPEGRPVQPVPTPRPAAEDQLLALLQALRADVETDAPVPVSAPVLQPALAPVIPLNGRRRRVHRAAVATAVAATVLSVSGVAAAGFSGTVTPLRPLHEAIWGPTASEQALKSAERFTDLAARHLEAGRLVAAGEALDQAEGALRRVDPENRGSLPARISQLRDALTAAFAADTAQWQAAHNVHAAAAPGRAHGAEADDHGKALGHGPDGDKPGNGARGGGAPDDRPGASRDDHPGGGSHAGDPQGLGRHGGLVSAPPSNDD